MQLTGFKAGQFLLTRFKTGQLANCGPVLKPVILLSS